jgi:hypothetical protein
MSVSKCRSRAVAWNAAAESYRPGYLLVELGQLCSQAAPVESLPNTPLPLRWPRT